MAALVETEVYEAEIYQLEITDPVIGGPGGIDNLQPKQLANRTKWLKAKVDSILSMSFIHAAVAENPGDTDELGYWDSLTLSIKKVTLANLKTILFGSPVLTGIPTAPTATNGTNTTQLATTAFAKTVAEANAIGVGQTWQNLTASRAPGTNYTNSTGKPIMVTFWGTSPSGVILSINAYVDEINVAYIYNQAVAGASTVGTVSFIVKNGGLYSIAHNSTATQSWSELR